MADICITVHPDVREVTEGGLFTSAGHGASARLSSLGGRPVLRGCLWSILLAGKQADGSPAYIRFTLNKEKRLWKRQTAAIGSCSGFCSSGSVKEGNKKQTEVA